jgi:hypothetical protein
MWNRSGDMTAAMMPRYVCVENGILPVEQSA